MGGMASALNVVVSGPSGARQARKENGDSFAIHQPTYPRVLVRTGFLGDGGGLKKGVKKNEL